MPPHGRGGGGGGGHGHGGGHPGFYPYSYGGGYSRDSFSPDVVVVTPVSNDTCYALHQAYLGYGCPFVSTDTAAWFAPACVSYRRQMASNGCPVPSGHLSGLQDNNAFTNWFESRSPLVAFGAAAAMSVGVGLVLSTIALKLIGKR